MKRLRRVMWHTCPLPNRRRLPAMAALSTPALRANSRRGCHSTPPNRIIQRARRRRSNEGSLRIVIMGHAERFHRQKGFSFVELMIVIVLIVIVAAIALPNFWKG